ncbi:PH domain-containing protein [Candidatus Saccharibacteria bacterium]|nr:PH domain-containing protein [Candidatus Saccharibacteria bacterium]MBQ6147436.1 PH domain-containing protein [Candidatus Saccharibacteria bacterium]
MKTSLARIRHARSKQEFPFLPLEEGEYVELALTRSKLGLVLIWGGVAIALLGIILFATIISSSLSASSLGGIPNSAMPYFFMLIISLSLALVVAGVVGMKIYNGNSLFVTNKRIFQNTMTGLFARSSNVIELYRIEDVSFKQSGIFDYLFKIGTIRMSTVGDETTYTFPFVDTPTDEVEMIAHLIHLSKDRNS